LSGFELGDMRAWIYQQVIAKKNLLDAWQKPKTRRGSLDIELKRREIAMLDEIDRLLQHLEKTGYGRTDESRNSQGTETRTGDAPAGLSEVGEGGPHGDGGHDASLGVSSGRLL
jgi:hypothetical protein